MPEQNEDWVAISVPKSIAPAVYALVAERMSADVSESSPATSPRSNSWTEHELNRLIDESPPAMKAILETLAQNPDTWLDSESLAKALRTRATHYGGENKPDANWQTVAGTLGAYGRRVKSRYGKEEWFHQVRSDAQGRYKHLMPAEYAEHVLARLSAD